MTRNHTLISILLPAILVAGSFPQAEVFPEKIDGPAVDRDLKKVEALIFKLTNEERKKQGLESYAPFSALEEAARRHSQAMADQQFFSHTDTENRNPNERFHEWFPDVMGGVGENIAFIQSPVSDEELAMQFIKNWMDSPAHKKNILSKQYSHLGVGIGIRASDGSVYGTQNFGDLQARVLSTTPAEYKYGDTIDVVFKYLGTAKPSRLSVFVRFPDPKAKHTLPDGSFYTGIGLFEKEWLNDEKTNFKIRIELDKGKGDYRILMGLDGSYYMPGYVLSVR